MIFRAVAVAVYIAATAALFLPCFPLPLPLHTQRVPVYIHYTYSSFPCARFAFLSLSLADTVTRAGWQSTASSDDVLDQSPSIYIRSYTHTLSEDARRLAVQRMPCVCLFSFSVFDSVGSRASDTLYAHSSPIFCTLRCEWCELSSGLFVCSSPLVWKNIGFYIGIERKIFEKLWEKRRSIGKLDKNRFINGASYLIRFSEGLGGFVTLW